MREFHLIDLSSQMTALPMFMKAWPPERILSWMRAYGEVCPVTQVRSPIMDDHYIFLSRYGLETYFVLRPGELGTPGMAQQAWQGA